MKEHIALGKFEEMFPYLLEHGWVPLSFGFEPMRSGEVCVIMVQQADIKNALLGKGSPRAFVVEIESKEDAQRLSAHFANGRNAVMKHLDAQIEEFMEEAEECTAV